jgi:hypothetical protein
MTRIFFTIEDHDKEWLEKRARIENVSRQELIRKAIRQMRNQATLAEALEATRGIWHDGDGLSYQRRLRREWR